MSVNFIKITNDKWITKYRVTDGYWEHINFVRAAIGSLFWPNNAEEKNFLRYNAIILNLKEYDTQKPRFKNLTSGNINSIRRWAIEDETYNWKQHKFEHDKRYHRFEIVDAFYLNNSYNDVFIKELLKSIGYTYEYKNPDYINRQVFSLCDSLYLTDKDSWKSAIVQIFWDEIMDTLSIEFLMPYTDFDSLVEQITVRDHIVIVNNHNGKNIFQYNPWNNTFRPILKSHFDTIVWSYTQTYQGSKDKFMMPNIVTRSGDKIIWNCKNLDWIYEEYCTHSIDQSVPNEQLYSEFFANNSWTYICKIDKNSNIIEKLSSVYNEISEIQTIWWITFAIWSNTIKTVPYHSTHWLKKCFEDEEWNRFITLYNKKLLCRNNEWKFIEVWESIYSEIELFNNTFNDKIYFLMNDPDWKLLELSIDQHDDFILSDTGILLACYEPHHLVDWFQFGIGWLPSNMAPLFGWTGKSGDWDPIEKISFDWIIIQNPDNSITQLYDFSYEFELLPLSWTKPIYLLYHDHTDSIVSINPDWTLHTLSHDIGLRWFWKHGCKANETFSSKLSWKAIEVYDSWTKRQEYLDENVYAIVRVDDNWITQTENLPIDLVEVWNDLNVFITHDELNGKRLLVAYDNLTPWYLFHEDEQWSFSIKLDVQESIMHYKHILAKQGIQNVIEFVLGSERMHDDNTQREHRAPLFLEKLKQLKENDNTIDNNEIDGIINEICRIRKDVIL
jgi:hypothetical protein